MRMTTLSRVVLLAALVAGVSPASTQAAIILQYEFNNQPGTETSVNPSFVASAVTGNAFGESSVLSPSAAAGFISSTGWNKAGAAYTFGFNVNAGQSVTVNDIDFASRSSGTGPGFLNLLASVDGAAAVVVASFAQNGTDYNDQMLAITSVTARQSLVFSIVVANSTSANPGGTTAGTGTFRIGDYAPGGVTSSPFTVNGTITAAGGTGPVSVPEPASCLLLGMGLIGGLVVARQRRSK